MKERNWDQLIHTTKQLTKPNAHKGLLTDQDISELKTALIRIINRFFDKGEIHKGLKIYVEGELKNVYADKMSQIKPSEIDGLQEWGKKVFEDQKYGVVFNSLESYDNNIVEQMCRITSPLIDQVGLPLGGLSFLFFMGNYGFTPFGIHKEAKGEEGFLFHLGPGNKDFYTWDNEELNQVEHNTVVFTDIEAMIPSSTGYQLSPGSVMYIPDQVFHIAKTEDFSISVVMDFINPSRDYLVKMLAKEVIEIEGPENVSTPYLKPYSIKSDHLKSSTFLDESSIYSKFEIALQRKIMKLKSNGGVLKPSIPLNKARLPNDDCKIKGKLVFPLILTSVDSDRSMIYARGNEISVSNNSRLPAILSRLNAGLDIEINLLKEELIEEWELSQVFSFIFELIRYEAVEVINEVT